jgi:response regulator RpfG family c-di-GMP phosphodiesterase
LSAWARGGGECNMELCCTVSQCTTDCDATLATWARSLELRDIEPEGHSERVSDMAVQLARMLGVSGEALVHVRRGALLHDVGKLAVPDRILFKLGPLSDTEWEVLRRHPVYAYQLLLPLAYVRPALDIPYYHHEKWDGTGYPEGLQGEAIPLPARLFAVVDVWDALYSDRCYRSAWPEDEINDYIHEQAGSHFDPDVVQAFFELFY